MKTASVDADGASPGPAVVTDYTYDDAGIRASQTADGVETFYLYDGSNDDARTLFDRSYRRAMGHPPAADPARQARRPAAPLVFTQLDKANYPRLTKVWADNKYRNHELDRWLQKNRDHWNLEIKSRPEGAVGFSPVPKRWVVERTFAWLGRDRRHGRDYERLTESSTAMLRVSSIHLMLRRLAPPPQAVPFHYRQPA